MPAFVVVVVFVVAAIKIGRVKMAMNEIYYGGLYRRTELLALYGRVDIFNSAGGSRS